MQKSVALLLTMGFILLFAGRTSRAQKLEAKLSGGQIERFDFE